MTGRLLAVGVAVGLLLVACGDDDDSSSDTSESVTTLSSPTTSAPPTTISDTTPAGDECAARDALRKSVDALTEVDVVAEGTNGLTAAVDDVKDDLAALRSSASEEVQPLVQDVQDDLDDLETAIADSSVSAAATALTELATSTGALIDALQERC